MTLQDQYRLLPVWWYYLSFYSAGMIIKVCKEPIQGVRKCSIMACQCSAAPVDCYAFIPLDMLRRLLFLKWPSIC